MTPLIPLLLGALAIATGLAALRTFGPRVRVGRLLGSAPAVSIAEARDLAAGPARYVRIAGRIDSTEEFEDPDHRPLVLRHRRVEIRRDGRWRTIDSAREVVPFELNEGLDTIAVDGGTLEAGLVVIPKMSEGVAAEVPDLVPPGTEPATPVRIVLEQVSSVEHAIVVGVPRLGSDGEPVIGPGTGRPLILTTLEPDEAMRVLAEGRGGRVRFAAIAMGTGMLLLITSIVWFALAAIVAAADPTASPGTGSDTRSPGEGPGLVGEPGLAILAVVGIAVLAILATAAYVRVTAPRDEGGGSPS